MLLPKQETLELVFQDIRNEVKECRANRFWSGGVIPSHIPGYFANVGPDGHFGKVYLQQGDRKDFFELK